MVTMTIGILAAPFRFDGFAATGIHIPFEGCWNRWLFPASAHKQSITFGAGKFDIGLVVSKSVLLMKYFPLPPRMVKMIFPCRTALVRWDDVRHTGDAAYRFFEFEETAAAGIYDSSPCMMPAHWFAVGRWCRCRSSRSMSTSLA